MNPFMLRRLVVLLVVLPMLAQKAAAQENTCAAPGPPVISIDYQTRIVNRGNVPFVPKRAQLIARNAFRPEQGQIRDFIIGQWRFYESKPDGSGAIVEHVMRFFHNGTMSHDHYLIYPAVNPQGVSVWIRGIIATAWNVWDVGQWTDGGKWSPSRERYITDTETGSQPEAHLVIRTRFFYQEAFTPPQENGAGVLTQSSTKAVQTTEEIQQVRAQDETATPGSSSLLPLARKIMALVDKPGQECMELSWHRPVTYGTDPRTRLPVTKEGQDLFIYRGAYWKEDIGSLNERTATGVAAMSWGGVKKSAKLQMPRLYWQMEWPETLTGHEEGGQR